MVVISQKSNKLQKKYKMGHTLINSWGIIWEDRLVSKIIHQLIESIFK